MTILLSISYFPINASNMSECGATGYYTVIPAISTPFLLLGIVFLEGGNELCISSYSIGLTYALSYIGLLEPVSYTRLTLPTIYSV